MKGFYLTIGLYFEIHGIQILVIQGKYLVHSMTILLQLITLQYNSNLL